MRALSDEARALAERAAREIEVLPEEAAARRAIALLAEAGLLAWTVPRRDGGAETDGRVDEDQVSVRALCELRRELAYASGMLDVVFVMQGLGSCPIALAGSAKLRARVLPQVARGTLVAALALTEPEAGSSLSHVTTQAERDGDRWRLSGHKTFVSNAPIADFFTVLARVPGEPEDAFAMFFVEANAKGIERVPFEVMAPHPIGEVFLRDVVLPAESLLGRVGGGLELALATLARFRTSVAAAATGFARRALDESIRHLRKRKQFGRPLATFQALRFDVAEMDTRLRASELLVAEAARLLDEGATATMEVARAKLFATESASWICDRAVQHLGGLGVKRGEVVERLFREVRALRIYEGTSEIQKLILAKGILGTISG
jgi:acyl-CoA dehydrogenase